MSENVCSNCKSWRYDRFTEENYGMGVGVCGADNSPQFCSHPCVFCRPIVEDEKDE